MKIQRTTTVMFTMELPDRRYPRIRELCNLLHAISSDYLVTDVELNGVGQLVVTCVTVPGEVTS